jgi:hypothetical protein
VRDDERTLTEVPVIASSVRRGLLALVTAGLVVAGLGAVAPGAAEAATTYGNDVSWPQCSTAQGGYGLPMPSAGAAFVVIGLTKGLPFTRNPCLASQVAWARDHAVPAQAYTMAAYPTNGQLQSEQAAGPWSPSTLTGRLANVGYAEARYAVDALAAAGFRPPMVWVDVEPRPAQPWLAGSDAARARNRSVVTGLLRGLDDAGYAYGLYSYTSGWADIVGSWRLPGVPVWATAGRRDAAAAFALCSAPSFSGGRVHLAQWYDDTRDSDLTCPAYAFAPARPYPPSGPGDLNGDWTSDVLAREHSTGALWLYPRGGTGGWLPRLQIGTGWQGLSIVDTADDLTNDGIPDVLAVERATGTLWIYPVLRTGHGLAPRLRAGSGWQTMDVVLGAGDISGDGVPDVLARERATGSLWLYRRTASGWGTRVRIGGGWQVMDAVLGAGDLTGDGRPDLLARERSTGYLWLYPGASNGLLGARTRIGTGWGSFDALAAPGDLDRNGRPDVVARERSTGDLWLYSRDDAGRWRPRVRIGTGWQIFDVVA